MSALVMLLLWSPERSWLAHAQSGIVNPEDVSTPAPTGVPLPTPTATPAVTATEEGGMAPGMSQVDSSGPAYTVRQDDTLWTVALEMGLDLDDVPCVIAPHFRMQDPLVIGDTLSAPAGILTCHSVQPGDTIASIAAEHQVDPVVILDDEWNELGRGSDLGAALEPGRYVRIVLSDSAAVNRGLLAYMLDRPIKEPPYLALARGGPVRSQVEALVPADWPYGSGQFEWPSTGWLTQGYRNDHRAVDIAAPLGTIVSAADRGQVVRAGWNSQGYGLFVVIDHNIDYVTLYSHLDEIFVAEGDIVSKGQALGTVGSTGNSTGPHLHFEVRDFGSRINPLEVLMH